MKDLYKLIAFYTHKFESKFLALEAETEQSTYDFSRAELCQKFVDQDFTDLERELRVLNNYPRLFNIDNSSLVTELLALLPAIKRYNSKNRSQKLHDILPPGITNRNNVFAFFNKLMELKQNLRPENFVWQIHYAGPIKNLVKNGKTILKNSPQPAQQALAETLLSWLQNNVYLNNTKIEFQEKLTPGEFSRIYNAKIENNFEALDCITTAHKLRELLQALKFSEESILAIADLLSGQDPQTKVDIFGYLNFTKLTNNFTEYYQTLQNPNNQTCKLTQPPVFLIDNFGRNQKITATAYHNFNPGLNAHTALRLPTADKPWRIVEHKITNYDASGTFLKPGLLHRARLWMARNKTALILFAVGLVIGVACVLFPPLLLKIGISLVILSLAATVTGLLTGFLSFAAGALRAKYSNELYPKPFKENTPRPVASNLVHAATAAPAVTADNAPETTFKNISQIVPPTQPSQPSPTWVQSYGNDVSESENSCTI